MYRWHVLRIINHKHKLQRDCVRWVGDNVFAYERHTNRFHSNLFQSKGRDCRQFSLNHFVFEWWHWNIENEKERKYCFMHLPWTWSRRQSLLPKSPWISYWFHLVMPHDGMTHSHTRAIVQYSRDHLMWCRRMPTMEKKMRAPARSRDRE